MTRRRPAPRTSGAGASEPIDAATLGRVGGALFGLASIIVLAQALLDDDQASDRPMLLVLAAAAAIVGLAAIALPASRWDRRTLVLLPLVGLVLLAIPAGGSTTEHLVFFYLPVLVFLGISQRRSLVLALVPVVVVSFIVGFGSSGVLTGSTIVHFALVLAVGVSLAFALSAILEPVGNVGLVHLLDGSRSLARSNDLAEAVAIFERSIVELVDADAVVTFVRDDEGDEPRLVRVRVEGRGRRRGPTGEAQRSDDSVEGVPIALVRLLDESRPRLFPVLDRGIAAGITDVLPSAWSALVVPLTGPRRSLGFAIVGWERGVRALNPVAREAVDLLAADASEAVDRARRQRPDSAPMTDPMTGLLSRRSVERRLDDLVAGDVVMVIDLDRFRDYNALRGASAGDRTVRTLAACLVDSCRRDDWCGRLTSEEFILVFRGAGSRAAVAVARVRDRWSDLHPDATFSAGVAVHEDDRPPSETLAYAEGALDLAKDRGRDRVEFFPGRAELGAG